MNPIRIKREELLSRLQSVQPGLSQTREIVEQSSCFTADTILNTLGGDFTVKELLDRGETKFKVFSTDGNQLCIGDAFNLHRARKNARVYLVTFDTGDVIKLTADHLVMMRDGSYREVKSLEEGDSVMPFNSWRKGGSYRMVYENLTHGRAVYACRWVYAQVHGRKKKGNHLHHIDLNPKNDRPENIKELTASEHARLHALLDPPSRKPSARAKQSARMMGNKCGVGPKPGTAKAMLGNKHGLGGPGNTSPRTEKQMEAIRRNCKLAQAARWRRRKECPNNHKVVSVEYVGREDVYDLSVRKYHNFAANGIFIHNCFAFSDGEVMTYNDEVSCRANSRLGSKITGAVKAKPLLDLLAKLTEEEVELEVSDGELVVSGARKRAGIRMEAEVMLAVSSVEEPGEWRKLPEDFDEALKIVFSCVGNDDTRFHLTCIHFAPEFIEACDNRQMARYTMDLGVEKDFLIRHAAMKQVNTLGMTEISESEAWVHFRNDNGLVMSCRRYVEEFPDLAKVIEMEGEPAVLPGGLAEAVEKAQIFAADSDDKKVLVELRPGKLRIKGEGNSGWFQEVKNIKYKGPDLNFRILPKLLAELCKRHNECEIAEDRLKVDGGKFVYVSCLSKADTKEVESNE